MTLLLLLLWFGHKPICHVRIGHPLVINRTRARPPQSLSPEQARLVQLRQNLRESDITLQSARDRITRLKGKEDLQKKAYDDRDVKKNDEMLDGYGELRSWKLATSNHFLTKWENTNEAKPKGEKKVLRR